MKKTTKTKLEIEPGDIYRFEDDNWYPSNKGDYFMLTGAEVVGEWSVLLILNRKGIEYSGMGHYDGIFTEENILRHTFQFNLYDMINNLKELAN
ncbi:MAG: hypothetical protein GY928_20780 [Colwellia sp.]|nr:hypothetical protein [Colwellia sp.]